MNRNLPPEPDRDFPALPDDPPEWEDGGDWQQSDALLQAAAEAPFPGEEEIAGSSGAPQEQEPYAAGQDGAFEAYPQQEDAGDGVPPQEAAYDPVPAEEPPQEYEPVPDAEGFPAPGEDMYQEPPGAPAGSWLGDGASDAEDRPRKRTIFKPRTRRPSFVLGVLVNSVRVLVLLVLIFGLAGLGAIVGIAKAYMETAPTLDLSAIDDQAQTSFIYDANRNLITEYKGSENRIMVSIDSMPLDLQHAFVAVEDARFYTHNGVDVKRIVGAFIANSVSGSQQGGSTITQQLIKNTLLSSEQSYKRKIQEAYLAMQLETRYTKQEILQAYLNTIYLGEDYYGVKVAAFGYFGRDNLKDLTLRECAMLAGMTNNPYYYNPRRNYYTRQSDTTDYAKITNDRTDYVLRCMYENQFITHEEYLAALDPSTARVLQNSPSSTELYPYAHYVEYAIRDVIRTLLTLNGLEDTPQNRNKMETELRTGGYHVYLALDTDIQKTVEQTLQNYSDYPALRDPSDKIYRARNADGTFDEIIQPQAAAVVLDYRTGEIKAIVGSRTAPQKRKTLNRAADMNMPVGSAIKPIAVYAPAIELGAGGGTVLYNMPVPIRGYTGSDGKDTWPQNYGGSSYRGPETIRTAITRSDNTAAAYCLMNFVGVERSADFLLRLGVSEKHINKTPFGLALGSSGISPVEMAVAFGVLGNGGVYQSPVTFLGIADSNQNILYDAHTSQIRRQVFKPSTAWLTIDMMKDVVSKGTGTSAKISGQTVAGKTGTNSDQKGVFFCGMTGYYCASVWIGHDNYKALSSKTTGGNSAAKLWKAFMEPIHKGRPNQDILSYTPEQCGLVRVTTCNVSGQLATDACRNDAMDYGTTTDYWPAETAPQVSCQMHYVLDVCSQSGMLATPYCPSHSSKGVVILPVGHPLYDLTNTAYASVLADYLGEYAALRLTADSNANAALLQSRTCLLHQTSSFPVGGGTVSPYDQGLVQNMVSDARMLLGSAQLILNSLSPDQPAYAGLSQAMSHLSGVIESNPTLDALTAAMSSLTQAMNAAQNPGW
ncbi:MAG: transglycosylase domain-containing protein [Clostridia bacterium]|nr:transglycosylase domain-containing protein [Clostridia bacterium]